MPATRRVLKHLEIQTAQRSRKCHRNKKKHRIGAGEAFLFVKEEGQGYSNYCMSCAQAILIEARQDLEALFAGLAIDGDDNPVGSR